MSILSASSRAAPWFALLAGVVSVASFAPLSAWPLMLLALGLLFKYWLEASPARAAWLGFMFGMGMFGAGVSWLYVSLHDFGGMPMWLAVPAVALFCAYVSIYPMLAGWLATMLRRRRTLSTPISLMVIFPAMFVASEMIRAWFVSGFPWLIVGYSQTPTGQVVAPLAGFAPIVGVFGISLALCVSAGAIVWLSTPLSGALISKPRKRAAWIAFTLLWLGGVLLQRVAWTQPTGAPVSVALLQGNVDQQLKWREDQRAAAFENYLALAEQSGAKLTVLPETAFPLFLHDVPLEALMRLKQIGERNQGDVVLGVAVVQAVRGQSQDARDSRDLDYFNSAISLGKSQSARYDKHHLVAFGEYPPPMFAWVFRWLSIPMSDFARGAAVQLPMAIAGTSVGVNICYEDTFGAEIARQLPAANLLVNVSNLAWFGRSFAADQHAQFSQMRALETGRWMLRATNTGVTAAINPRGEIVASLPQFTRGVLKVDAQPYVGSTPYVRWTDWPVHGLIVLGLAFAFLRRRVAAPRNGTRSQ